MWTNELIKRFKKYVDGSRYFVVSFHGQQVYGLDIPPDEYPLDQAVYYLNPFDEGGSDGPILADTKPTDFTVQLLMPVDNWTEQDPDWSKADPECWAETHQ